MNNLSLFKDKNLVCWWRHYGDTNNISEYENTNPKTQKVFKVIKGNCDNCGRNKSQTFTN